MRSSWSDRDGVKSGSEKADAKKEEKTDVKPKVRVEYAVGRKKDVKPPVMDRDERGRSPLKRVKVKSKEQKRSRSRRRRSSSSASAKRSKPLGYVEAARPKAASKRNTGEKQKSSKEQDAASAAQTASKPASNDVPDWLADLVPQGGSAPMMPVAPAPQLTSVPVEVPQSLVALLTANGGATIKAVAEATSTEISLRQDCMHLGYSLAIITGTVQSALLAKQQLQQCIGLGGTAGTITKQIELSREHLSAVGAMDLALAEIRGKAGYVPMAVLPPTGPGAPVRVNIGPGPVAHVATAEQLIRKKLNDIELDMYQKLGKPVPIEKKVAMICKFWESGAPCPRGIACQFCHGTEELKIAQQTSRPERYDASSTLSLPALKQVPESKPGT